MSMTIVSPRPSARTGALPRRGAAAAARTGRPVGRPEACADRGRLRLTRRGRLAVFLLALTAVLLLSVFVGAGSVATHERGATSRTQVVVVGDGDTLWEIASDVAAETGSGDVRQAMDDIERLNALESPMLMAGQRIRVPMGD